MYFYCAERRRNPFGRPVPRSGERREERPESGSGGFPLASGVPAVLLRVDRNPFHHGTLGAARTLGRAGVPVHVIAEEGRGPLARSRHVVATYRQPAPGSGTEGVVAALEDLAGRLDTPAVLIPMDDLGAVAVDSLPPALAARFLLPAQPPGLAARVADKAQLAGVCAEAGVPHPRTVQPGSAKEAEAAVRALGPPVVAKWSRPWLLPPGSGLRSTKVLRTAHEAAELYARTPEAGSALLLQEFLPAGPGRDWFCHAYADREGRLRAGGTGRKERSWPPGAGLTAVGRWAHDEKVADSTRRLVEILGYRGILDLDYRLDPATGAYHLLDFNPRAGAQFRLFTDRGGLDVVRAQHLDLTDRPLPPRAPLPGRRFTVGNYAVLSALREPSGATGAAEATDPAPGSPAQASPAPARLPLRDAREGAWWAADDPAPALAMATAWTLHLLRRAIARPRREGTEGGAVLPAAPRRGEDDEKASSTPCTTS